MFILCLCFFSYDLFSATYYSRATGNWNVASTWSTVSCNGTAAAIAPSASDDVVICNGHTVTVSASASIRNVTINNGGTLRTSAALTINAASTFTIQSGGTYFHDYTLIASTSIFNGTESFDPNSTIRIEKWNSLATSLVTGVNSNFGHLILRYNTGVSAWINNGLGVSHIIQGNFTVSNSCRTNLSSTAGNVSITIGGNLTISENAQLRVKGGSNGNAIFNVSGNTIISGANSTFYGIYESGNAGDFTFTTVNYTQSGGFFYGQWSIMPFGVGDVSLTTSGLMSLTAGEHIGIDYPFSGNWGICTYNLHSFSLTGGSFVLHKTEITDGRVVTLNVLNNFTIQFSNLSDYVRFGGHFGGTQDQVYNISIGGNFSVSGNSTDGFSIKNDGTGNDNFDIANNLILGGGPCDFSSANPSMLTWNVGGNVSITGGTHTVSTIASSSLNLVLGAASSTWQQTGGTINLCNTNIKTGKTLTLIGNSMGAIQASRTILVESGATLNTSNFPLTGAGHFTLSSGATLGIGSIAGIVSAGASGNVQVGGTRTYNSGATYRYYEGLSPQATGNFTTTPVGSTVQNLIIDKASALNIVNLTNTTNVNGSLTLTNGILTTSFTAGANPFVRINNGASVSPAGGSANSYVNGFIRKVGGTAFVFPTGSSGGKWRRIGIDAPSASTEFEARYISSPYANTTSMAVLPLPALDHVSTVEHWILNKPGGAASTKVTLYWEDASASGLLKFDSLVVARFNGSAWENTSAALPSYLNNVPERTYTGVAWGTGAGTIRSNTISTFSPFTLSSIGVLSLNPLPVSLLSYSADCHNEAISLKWVTASEQNSSHFTLYKAIDNTDFSFLAHIPAAGRSASIQEYSYTDSKSPGKTYYKLTQTDVDGYTQDFGIVHANCAAEYNLDIVHVSVQQDRINALFAIPETGTYELVLTDILGKIVYSEKLSLNKGNQVFSLPQMNIAGSLYFITLRNEMALASKKFIAVK